jgi:hypothetical protein
MLGELHYSIFTNLQINGTLYKKLIDKLISDSVSKTEIILHSLYLVIIGEEWKNLWDGQYVRTVTTNPSNIYRTSMGMMDNQRFVNDNKLNIKYYTNKYKSTRR